MIFKGYLVAIYYLTLLLFAAGGLLLNLYCLLLFFVPRTDAAERYFQRVAHRAFRLFIGWMALTRVCRVRYDAGIRTIPAGTVVVANHPGLMDVTYLLARIPEAFCLFKPAIRRNPIMAALACRAGYVVSNSGVDTIRAASDKVATGHTLVMFPEGTRTPRGMPLGVIRPGFELIARRARAPIQFVRIHCNSAVLAKGWSLGRIPVLPIQVSVELGPRITPDAAVPAGLPAQRFAEWAGEAGGTGGAAALAGADPKGPGEPA